VLRCTIQAVLLEQSLPAGLRAEESGTQVRDLEGTCFQLWAALGTPAFFAVLLLYSRSGPPKAGLDRLS
jgi:hypothetical protein